MVVVLAPDDNKICASFTHNQLWWSHGNPTFLSLMIIQKEGIANVSEFESYSVGGQNGCA